jgi:DNA primase
MRHSGRTSLRDTEPSGRHPGSPVVEVGTRESHAADVAPTEPDQTTDLRALTEVTAAAAVLLTAVPRRRAAVTYLRQRGVDAAALPAEWPLGYAPPGWTRLVDQLCGRFGDEVLLDAGLALRSSRGTLIDTFRDRVIVPMHDRKGRVAGFIGRDVSGNPDTPKYLNTRQTPLFDKGELLYGLHEAQTTNPAARHLVIVEGPLDVLAIAARGHTIGDTDLLPIAASGTAFTIAHARRVAAVAIAHHSPVVVALDGDAAGRAAALRAGEKLRSLGRTSASPCCPTALTPPTT